MIDVDSFSDDVERLLRAEGLDDVAKLVATQSWEAYPIFSREHRIGFLRQLDPLDRSYVLFAYALRHLDRIVEVACETLSIAARRDFVAMLSLQGWDEVSDGGFPVPSFFICTKVRSFMAGASIRGVRTPHGRVVAEWLERLHATDAMEIAEAPNDADLDTFAVYVGFRQPHCPGILTLRDVSRPASSREQDDLTGRPRDCKVATASCIPGIGKLHR